MAELNLYRSVASILRYCGFKAICKTTNKGPYILVKTDESTLVEIQETIRKMYKNVSLDINNK